MDLEIAADLSPRADDSADRNLWAPCANVEKSAIYRRSMANEFSLNAYDVCLRTDRRSTAL